MQKRKGRRSGEEGKPGKKDFRKSFPSKKKPNLPKFDEEVRLNKYLAHAGVCSRREADTLIQAGAVEVNGQVVTELGVKVNPNKDTIKYGGETLRLETKRYVLLNKPKDFITSVTDPHGRRTVMQLVKSACKERVVPVGRLDRQTTGLLLFTNDGDLAKKLTHPRFRIKKVYHVVLDKNFSTDHMEQLRQGITLDDGLIKPDKVEFVKETYGGREVGIEIHSGRNRIVRRIFEYFGYNVIKLDRVMFGFLTKKDLPRGHYRHLTEMEVQNLKNL